MTSVAVLYARVSSKDQEREGFSIPAQLDLLRLLRLLGDQGDGIRARLRRQKALKLATGKQVGKAYTPEEKQRLLAEARTARSPVIYPALMLALHAGMRDAEIRTLQWERLDLSRAYLTVGDSKTEAFGARQE